MITRTARTLTVLLTAAFLTAALAQNTATMNAGRAIATELNATAGCAYLQDLTNEIGGYCWTASGSLNLHKALLEIATDFTLGATYGLTVAAPLPWDYSDEGGVQQYTRIYVINGIGYGVFLISHATSSGKSLGVIAPLE